MPTKVYLLKYKLVKKKLFVVITQMFREHVIVVGGLGSEGLAAVAANNLARPGVGLDVPLQQ
jgi:hypothetical protein